MQKGQKRISRFGWPACPARRGRGPLALVLLAALLGAACAQTESLDEASYQRGLAVYLGNSCGACHQLAAAETVGFFGPTHEAIGVIAGARVQDPNYRGAAEDAEDYLRESLLDPRAYLVPGYALTPHRMPAYTVLDEADLDALVYFLLLQPLPSGP